MEDKTKNNREEKTNNKEEKTDSLWFSNWQDFKTFLYDSFWKTPMEKIETIFQLLLLGAGATRTVDFMTTMGQSGLMAVIALVYAEAGILIYEVLGYKAKRVKVKKYSFWTKKEIEAYPFFNQRSIARFGIVMHMVMTAVFTTSDIVLSTLKSSAIGQSVDVSTTFAWVLGLGIGITFFANLVLILIYKNVDPELQLKEEIEQLDYEHRISLQRIKKIEKRHEMDYREKNAPKLAEKRAKLNEKTSLINEFGDLLGRDDVKSIINDDVDVKDAEDLNEVKNNKDSNF